MKVSFSSLWSEFKAFAFKGNMIDLAVAVVIGAAFSGVTLATTREDLVAAIIRGLIAESVLSYEMLGRVRKPERTVYCMGGAGVLGEAMRAAWHGQHVYRKLEDDSLAGLVQLATKMIVPVTDKV